MDSDEDLRACLASFCSLSISGAAAIVNLKYTMRQLLKSPGFTLVALLTLGLTVGANLTIFAVLDAILVRSLPFPESDRLVVVHNAYPATGIRRGKATIGDYFDRREALDAFESVSMFRQYSYTIGEAGSTRRVEVGEVTPEFFRTLGIPFAMGHGFTDAELEYGQNLVAILTDRFWRNYFNQDPEVVGRTLMTDGLTHSVIAVLPPGFRYLSSTAEVYVPLAHFPKHRRSPDRHSARARWHDGQMIARLAANASCAEAQTQLAVLDEEILSNDPMGPTIRDTGYYSWVAPLHDDHVSSVKPMLVLLQSGGVCLLLIGSVNLAGLLLVRTSGHGKEIAVRKALGAGRWHLTSKALVDSIGLTLCGGVFGVMLGAFGLRLTKLLGTDMLPLGADIRLDGRTVIIAIVASLGIGICISLPIIWLYLRDATSVHLRSQTLGSTTSRSVQRLRHSFIVAQIAIAFVLLCGAGLLGVSLKKTLDQSPGFESEYLLTGELTLPWRDYGPDSSRVAFVRRLLDRLRSVPGVRYAAISTALPFTTDGEAPTTILTEGATPGVNNLRSHYVSTVTSDYWNAMDIPLLRGRFLQDADSGPSGVVWYDTQDTGPPRVAVIDEAFARQHWPDGDAIGRRFSTDSSGFHKRSTFTVVGLVGNVKQSELAETQGLGSVYLPYVRIPEFQVIIRTSVSPDSMVPMLEKVVRELDPNLPISDIKNMETRIDDSLIVRRSPAILVAIFAGVALLLAAIGTYSVLAYAVTQRRREIAVRIAVGATREQIGWRFVALGLKLLLVGILLGCFGAWAAGRGMQSMLFQVPPLHPPTLAATGCVMSVVTLIACLLPALRAANVDPMEALRSE